MTDNNFKLLCESLGLSVRIRQALKAWDNYWLNGSHDPRWLDDEGVEETIRQVLTSQLAITKGESVVVPVTPTEEMCKAGDDTEICHSWSSEGEFMDEGCSVGVYQAMIKAIQEIK